MGWGGWRGVAADGNPEVMTASYSSTLERFFFSHLPGQEEVPFLATMIPRIHVLQAKISSTNLRS